MDQQYTELRCAGTDRRSGERCPRLLVVVDAKLLDMPVDRPYALQIKCKCGHMNVFWLGKEHKKSPASVS